MNKSLHRCVRVLAECMAVAAMLLYSIPAIAQSRAVSGVVTDANGPLFGVSVHLKGVSTGVTTGNRGEFTIQASPQDVLVFEYMGYLSKEIAVGAKQTVSVTLASDTKLVDPIVVVGYGTQKKSLVTGAISTVKGSDLEKTGITRADDALAGKVAGVQIISNSGQPGSGVDVRIRGIGSNNNTQPRYVVDGLEVGGIEFLNPQDIESMEVLKDAAAAAIYGARGANGVVIITTKHGKAGTSSINYNYSYGIQNIARKVDVLNAREYCIIQNEAAANGGTALPFTEGQINSFNRGTDWQEAVLYRNAPTQQHQLSFNASTAKSTFNASASYLDQNGILAEGKSHFRRWTTNVSSESKFLRGDVLTIGENIILSRVDKKAVTQNSLTAGPLVGAVNMDPLTPVYDPFNPYPEAHGFGISKYVSQEVVNPVARIAFSYPNNYYTTVKGGIYGELKFLKDFKLRGTANADITWDGSTGYTPIYRLNSTTATTHNGASQSMDEYDALTFNGTLTWGHKYCDKHNISAMGGWEYVRKSGLTINGTRNDLIIDSPQYAYLSLGTSSTPGVGGGRDDGYEYALLSYFARVNYDYDNKYMMTFNIRYDGSSNFGPNNKFGLFPSVSAGWNITKEKFMQNVNWLNSLKLRASWGQNGNDNIGTFQYLSTISTYGMGYVFGSQIPAGSISTGSAPRTIDNPNLKWEASEQTDVGLDARLFSNFTLTVDYYIKATKDLLMVTPISRTTGLYASYKNAGNIRNTGLEISAGYSRSWNHWSFNANANVSFNKNKATYVATATKIIQGPTVQGFGSQIISVMREGSPVGCFWLYKTDGIFQNWDQINSYTYTDPNSGVKTLIQPNAKPGDFRFVDANHDGKIDDNDRGDCGSGYPKIIYGVNLSATFYNFDLQINTYGTSGSKIFSAIRRNDLTMCNYPAWILDRWHGEGTSNSTPRVTTVDDNHTWGNASDFYLKPGDFFRIRNLALGYSIKLDPKYYLTKIRVFAAVNNLFTFSKYQGFDPEMGGSILGLGIDQGVYPRARTISFGASLDF